MVYMLTSLRQATVGPVMLAKSETMGISKTAFLGHLSKLQPATSNSTYPTGPCPQSMEMDLSDNPPPETRVPAPTIFQ